jgi:hypothetical protein
MISSFISFSYCPTRECDRNFLLLRLTVEAATIGWMDRGEGLILTF